MTLAELRTLAWHTLACRSCGEPTGRRCVTSSGARTVPHQPRMEDLNVWLSRQPEVDALTARLAQTTADLSQANDTAADLAEQLKTARAGAALVPGLQTRVAELMARVAELEKPPPVVTPPTTDIPAGYRLLRKFDLSKNEGWVLETGKPSNADGVDRPANVKFGAGPEGKSMELLANREGSTVYTCDARGSFQAIPNYHRVRWVIEKDPMEPGVWPGLWARPLGGGEGEIDYWEQFYANAAKSWPVDAGTLHTTPYDATHKQVQRKLPDMTKGGRYTIEFELAPGVARWWVNGVKATEITKAQFDAATGNRWDAMYGQASKNWYLRCTQQAGGIGGGPIPATFDQWRVWVHELSVFVPEK
jgi:hypothetical protein